MTKTTWEPPKQSMSGTLSESELEKLPDSAFAFPKQRKEPLSSASHVRVAAARFNQVEGVSDEDRRLAWANIEKAARHWHIELTEDTWQEAMTHNE
ncbi:MAG: hypothetical protein M5U01_08860 [Ardenticatenaceae bacterium]|nr:hypothetical protein [Ardenticatenaceae bacterium]